MQDRILFIAGGPWQRSFIEYLKKRGHFVAVVNPVVTSSTELADYHIKSDVNDLSLICDYIHDLKLTLITSDQSDISTMVVAKLSEVCSTHSNSVQCIQKFTDKFEIFKFASSIGIPVPKTEIVKSYSSIVHFGIKYGYPIIIKPIDATHSRGFYKINCVEEISNQLLESCLSFSKSKTAIVQNFIDGSMITLEGICSGYKHKTLASSIKLHYFRPGINSDVHYPSNLKKELLNEIISINDFYVESSGMKFGLTHSEYIINENGYFLIEIGARGGGAGISSIITPWVSGVNSYDLFYDSLMGKVVDVKKIVTLERHAVLQYYSKDEMINCNQDKAIKARLISGVGDFQYDFIGKQYVKDTCDDRHSLGIYLSDSFDGLNDIINSVHLIVKGE